MDTLTTPLISILIPTWNRPQGVISLIERINSAKNSDLEIVIVDDNSEERKINSNYIEKLSMEKDGIANNYYEIFPPQGFFWTDDWNPEIVGYFSKIKDVWGLDYSLPEYF